MGASRHLIRAAVAAAALTAAPAAPAQATPDGLEPGITQRLSDERTLSRWAHPERLAPVRTQPDPAAPAITRLRFDTEDGLHEVYLALRSTLDGEGREWIEIRLPMRPNGTTGWVPRDALGRFHVVRTMLRIDRARLRATLYRSGRRIWSAPVGVGKPSSPTPAGRFYIRERLRPPPGTIYGALAFGTSAYSGLSDWPGGGVVGLHGTDQPHLIPGRPSNGCVRVRDGALRRLGRLLPKGTPVRIV
ncbi:MAG TPA: L,D-transpeptidase family protein [Solirubrobacteraceae bacterium]|nr:L,D-transpeptidase family protein [Solirubrobacteraceae bacterium]